MTLELITEADATIDALPNEDDLLRWARAALEKSGQWEVGLRIVGLEESRALNRDYRGKDRATNVLSFPFELPPGVTSAMLGEETVPLGDLVICAPLVEEEAATQGKPLLAHWAHLVVHGILHLQGYDHVLDQDAEVMENQERRILATLGFQDPYA